MCSGHWHRGQHGWVSVADFGALDWEELDELLRDAWRRTVSKRLVQAFPPERETRL